MPSAVKMRFNKRLSNVANTMEQTQPSEIIPVAGEKKVFEISKQQASKNGFINEQLYSTYTTEFLHKEPCRYSHEVFLLASQLFGFLKHEPLADRPFKNPKAQGKTKQKDEPSVRQFSIDFKSERNKRLAFELVFTTLKYQRFLEDMIDDCSFFNNYPEFLEDEDLVMVILCDFQKRKFQTRVPIAKENLIKNLLDIEEALNRCKTKLNAALARSRIKARVLSIDQLLPESVRQTENVATDAVVYAWVNKLKTDMRHVQSVLNSEGCRLISEGESALSGSAYCKDSQCSDVLAFPSERRLWLEDHDLVTTGRLVLQDKSSCLAVEAVHGLVGDGDDVLHINVGSGLTAVHLASLLSLQDCLVFSIGATSDDQLKRVSRNVDKLRANNYVKVLKENFLQIENTDDRLRTVRVILVTANCTRSGVNNPVGFVVTEEEDMDILTSLSVGSSKKQTLKEKVSQHTALLKKALQLPSVQAVVYCTRSVYEAENEEVVAKSLMEANEYLLQNTSSHRRKVCRLVPPTVSLSQEEVEGLVDGKYLKYPPSTQMSGCFIATLVKEVEHPAEAAKDAISKAMSKGTVSSATTEASHEGSVSTTKSKGSKTKKGVRKKAVVVGGSTPVAKVAMSHPVKTRLQNSDTASKMTGSTEGSTVVSQLGERLGGGGPTSHMRSFVSNPSTISDDSYARLLTNRTVLHAPPKRMATPPHRKVVLHPAPFRIPRAQNT